MYLKVAVIAEIYYFSFIVVGSYIYAFSLGRGSAVFAKHNKNIKEVIRACQELIFGFRLPQ